MNFPLSLVGFTAVAVAVAVAVTVAFAATATTINAAIRRNYGAVVWFRRNGRCCWLSTVVVVIDVVVIDGGCRS